MFEYIVGRDVISFGLLFFMIYDFLIFFNVKSLVKLKHITERTLYTLIIYIFT